MELEENINQEDRIQELGGLENATIRRVKQKGISKISDFLRFSDYELMQILKMTKPDMMCIKSEIAKRYGKKYEELQGEVIERGPEEVATGHLGISDRICTRLRKNGIYTIGDVLKTPRRNLLKIKGIFEISIEQLSEKMLSISEEYTLRESEIDKLGLSERTINALDRREEGPITTIAQLENLTWEELIRTKGMASVGVEDIITHYVQYKLKEAGKDDNDLGYQVEILAKIVEEMTARKISQERKKQTLKDLLNEIEGHSKE